MLRHLIPVLFVLGFASCSFFGEKNKVGDYIEKPDYSLKSVEYVPVLPNFGEGITPVSISFGYDELLYAVDSAKAIISYDAAGKRLGTFNLPNVYFVIQNRSLDLYALGRVDTVINNLSFNLPVVYKISQKVAGEGLGNTRLDLNSAQIVKKLIYPFSIKEPGKLTGNKANVEATQLGAIGFMDDNSYYVTSSGPQETANEFYNTRRNSILTFNNQDVFQGGFTEGDQVNSLSPFGLTSLVQPPQRARMETKKDFIYTVLTKQNNSLAISVRYMEVKIDPDLGLTTNFKPLAFPTAADANGYMYQAFRFKKPSAVLYAGTSQRYIFVADAGTDSILVFQDNGYEGTNPPPQYTNRKLIKVSFGGTGSGPMQFKRPSGLAFFDRTLFVADPGNKRISRFKLTSDYD
jgi:hypothetical protein